MSIGASRPDPIVAEAQAPVLSVAGLTTSFLRERQWIPVVRNVSFDIARQGDSGDRRRVRLGQERHRALDHAAAFRRQSGRIEGSITLAGRDLLTLPEAQMREVRGNDVAMIFQEPMTSLNPVFTIGFQIAEALDLPSRPDRARRREAETMRLLEQVRIPVGDVALRTNIRTASPAACASA